MLANSLSMANRLLPIQYTPRAAGRVKQIHKENRGMMIMVILADWSMVDFLVCSTLALMWLVTIIDTTPSAAEITGISHRPKAWPTFSCCQNRNWGV